MQIFSKPNTLKSMAILMAVLSLFLFCLPRKTIKAEVVINNQYGRLNMFNYFFGPNPNDPDYNAYAKNGIAANRITGNYGDSLQPQVPVANQKVLYWDRPITFYGVPPSPTHGAAAITPSIPGQSGIYLSDLAHAGGPVYVSGANYGNGRPVWRPIDTNGARAIVPGGYLK